MSYGIRYTTSFRLSCQKDNGNWTEVESSKIFQGNYDGETIVSNKLASPIECRALRIIPNEKDKDSTTVNYFSLRSEVMVIV